MTGTQLLSNPVKSRSAKQRIASFRQRFGEGHFYLACHAAMPVSLTPDLLYSLWANFQRNTHGDAIEIPWVAVADFMLSSLCEEVGQELYEIDQEVQDELLKQLQQDSRLGLERIRELADFVIAYVEQQLDSPDLDVRDLAQGQQWKALAYKNPSEAARSIATVLAQLPLSDKSEWIRMDSLIGSFAEPLSAYQPLLNYIRAMASLARDNLDAAIAQMSKAVDTDNQVRIEGINLPIPDILQGRLPDLTEPNAPPVPYPNQFVLPIAIIGGMIASLLILIGIQNGLQSPNSQSSPKIASSVFPSPRTTSPASPGIQRSPSTSPSPSASNPSPLATLAPSPSQERSIPSTSVSPTSVPTTVPGSVSPSAAVPQKTSSPIPSASVSPSPDSQNVPTSAVDAFRKQMELQQELAKIRASRPGEPLTVSPDGQYIASGGRDGAVRLWERNGRLLKEYSGYQDSIYGLVFSPDGKILATAGADGTVKLWNLAGQVLVILKGHLGAATSVSFSPDGKVLATAGADGTVRLWLRDGTLITTLKGHLGAVNSVSFSPDGKMLATAGADGTVRLWLRDGMLITTLKGHSDSVNSVSFSPDGKMLATASTDGTVGLWLRDGTPIATLKGHLGAVNSVSFSPDGRMITTVGADNTTRNWDLNGELIQATRN